MDDFNLPPELANNPDYEVLRELGRGGMGIVYLAKHRLSGRMEVLKVMNKDQLGRAESRKRFLREIQSAALLDHKNVVKMYTAQERGESIVLVMEYVPGEDLAQVIDSRGALSVLNACYYVQQVASGLQHAFEKGMIHRDIKPQNLMLLREGKKHVVKILDFGLAKVACEAAENTGLTGAGKIMGTPDYIAPEQTTDASSVDIRADIYSLGCTLYHLLAGDTPFAGRNAYAVIYAHQSLEAPALHVVRPEVPELVSSVVAKMMAKEPAHRYQTPLEVVRALEPLIKGTLNPLPPPVAAPQEGQRVAASRSLLNRETILVGRASSAGTMKPVGAMRSRKWLAVSLAVVLVAGLLGLMIWVGSKKPLSSEKVAIRKTTLRNELFKAKKEPLPSVKVPAKTVTNSIGMKLAWVPPGKSWLGGGGGKPGTQEFTLAKGLWCGVYPVTQAEWQAIMGTNPSKFAGKPRHPVEQVSWDDVQEFLKKLNSRLADGGLTYLLPTAEEWEYICRGGPISQNQSAYHFYFARSKSDLTSVPTNDLSSRQANFDGNYPAGSASKGPYLEATSEVGLYLPNPLGIYDLHGNVWEWTSTPEGSSRLIRGGSGNDFAGDCSASFRRGSGPGYRFDFLGFRVLAVPSGAR